MKKIYNSWFLITLVLMTLSCQDDFEEINTNSVDPTSTSVDPVFLLNSAIINTSFSNAQLIYDMGVVQQIVSPNSGVLTGANYNQDNRDVTDDHWVKYYENVIKNTGDILGQLEQEGAPSRPNLKNITRLVKALTFMILTDEYGDIPYFEAGKGIYDQIVLPKYDAQEAIYKDLIKEVREAVAGLNASAMVETGEVMYAGDTGKWRRFGNSLLLRVGMHLSEVDPALAEEIVREAFAAGVMRGNEDNYVVRHDNNYLNDNGALLNATEANNIYLVDTFVDYLLETEDPRLGALAIRYTNATSGPDQIQENGSTAAVDQIGMPMGYDNGTIGAVAENMGLASFYAFSQIDRYRVVRQAAPMFIITHAQTQLLLAEAAVRGWVSGNPADYYNTGIRAHMELMVQYHVDSEIPAADINSYLTNNPFNPADAMQQIGTQYWVACFLNGPEAFANFRRTGYPILTPNPYPSQDITGDFINRLTYPNSEVATNTSNLNEAVSRMGTDDLNTKVWWDK